MWVTDISSLSIPKKILDWLKQPYKLHEAYERICKKIEVEIIRQESATVFPEETIVLDIKDQDTIYVREIFIQCNGNRISFARTAIPHSTYLANKEEFDSLGKKLIGKTMLYDKEYVVREKFEYSIVENNTSYFCLIQQYLGGEILGWLYGRRSVFRINGMPLLITEIFLPSIPDYIPG